MRERKREIKTDRERWTNRQKKIGKQIEKGKSDRQKERQTERHIQSERERDRQIESKKRADRQTDIKRQSIILSIVMDNSLKNTEREIERVHYV